MNLENLQKVIAAFNEVIRLPHGKAPDTEMWLRLLDARGTVQVELYREEYKQTGKLPEVTV